MNKKRNVSYIKPEDPEFLKVLKKQAGYDDRNHKFDELENAEDDFLDDGDNEQPQVVVLREGDLTAEQAEVEKQRIEKLESETKADLNERVMFKSKKNSADKSGNLGKRKDKDDTKSLTKDKKTRQLLSFDDDADEEEE